MKNEFTNNTQFIVTEHNNGHVVFCDNLESARYEASEFQKSAPRNSDVQNYSIFTREEWLDILAENEGGQ